MENTMNTTNPTMSSPIFCTPGSTSAFAMPTRGRAFLGGDSQPIVATGLSTIGSIVRDRKDLAAKGHMALVAYVPGFPAWSPPLC